MPASWPSPSTRRPAPPPPPSPPRPLRSRPRSTTSPMRMLPRPRTRLPSPCSARACRASLARLRPTPLPPTRVSPRRALPRPSRRSPLPTSRRPPPRSRAASPCLSLGATSTRCRTWTSSSSELIHHCAINFIPARGPISRLEQLDEATGEETKLARARIRAHPPAVVGPVLDEHNIVDCEIDLLGGRRAVIVQHLGLVSVELWLQGLLGQSLLLGGLGGDPCDALLGMDVLEHKLPRPRVGRHLAPALGQVVHLLLARLERGKILLSQCLLLGIGDRRLRNGRERRGLLRRLGGQPRLALLGVDVLVNELARSRARLHAAPPIGKGGIELLAAFRESLCVLRLEILNGGRSTLVGSGNHLSAALLQGLLTLLAHAHWSARVDVLHGRLGRAGLRKLQAPILLVPATSHAEVPSGSSDQTQ
eukprot:m.224633 g.224633  ORF g.224633 m.224633 type:complete len:421 (-) comp11124_c0_seq1:38-1300(-)